MSVSARCFWDGDHDFIGLPHGVGVMTLFESVTGEAFSVEPCSMSHGVPSRQTECMKIAPVVDNSPALAAASYLDVYDDIDDAWLLEDEP
jgi:hypothetical protein